MIHTFPSVLGEGLLRAACAAHAKGGHVDGRATNANSTVKRNQQLPAEDAAAQDIGRRIVDALFEHPLVQRVAFPSVIPLPTFSRYSEGMAYGPHLDEALLQTQPTPIRSDLSCTVFLSDPGSYQGGELEIWLGSERPRIKLPAGSVALYPTGVIHQVLPVTSGERLVAVTWIQSRIANPQHRHVLFHHLELMHRLAPKCDEGDRLLLESVRTNLMRLWAEP